MFSLRRCLGAKLFSSYGTGFLNLFGVPRLLVWDVELLRDIFIEVQYPL